MDSMFLSRQKNIIFLSIGIGFLSLIVGFSIGIAGENIGLLIIGFVICLLLCYAISKQPGVGLLLLIFSIGFDNKGVGMPIIGILSIGKISGIIVIIGSIINLITRNNIKVQINRITVLIIAFVFYATISIIWASDYSLYVFRLERILFSFILFIFTFLVISNQKSINYIIHHLWKVIGLLNLIVVVAYNTPFEIISNNFQSNGRLSGGMGDPNEFALFNIALLPFVLSRCLNKKNGSKNVLPWFSLILSLIAIVQTQSRAGLLVLPIIGIISAIFLPSVRKPIRLISYFGMITALFLITINLNPEGMLRFSLGENIADVVKQFVISDARPTLWLIGLSIFKAHPIIGIGLGNIINPTVFNYFENSTQVFRPIEIGVVHNGFIEIMAELGLIGIILYGLIFIISIRKLFSLSKELGHKGYTQSSLFARSLALSLIGFSMMIFFISEQYAKILWILLALACSMILVSSNLVTLSNELKKNLGQNIGFQKYKR